MTPLAFSSPGVPPRDQAYRMPALQYIPKKNTGSNATTHFIPLSLPNIATVRIPSATPHHSLLGSSDSQRFPNFSIVFRPDCVKGPEMTRGSPPDLLRAGNPLRGSERSPAVGPDKVKLDSKAPWRSGAFGWVSGRWRR